MHAHIYLDACWRGGNVGAHQQIALLLQEASPSLSLQGAMTLEEEQAGKQEAYLAKYYSLVIIQPLEKHNTTQVYDTDHYYCKSICTNVIFLFSLPGIPIPVPSVVSTGVGMEGGGGASAKSWWGLSAWDRGFCAAKSLSAAEP